MIHAVAVAAAAVAALRPSRRDGRHGGASPRPP
jgi:hypothetical protein